MWRYATRGHGLRMRPPGIGGVRQGAKNRSTLCVFGTNSVRCLFLFLNNVYIYIYVLIYYTFNIYIYMYICIIYYVKIHVGMYVSNLYMNLLKSGNNIFDPTVVMMLTPGVPQLTGPLECKMNWTSSAGHSLAQLGFSHARSGEF